jgi:hypothetical protein
MIGQREVKQKSYFFSLLRFTENADSLITAHKVQEDRCMKGPDTCRIKEGKKQYILRRG